VVEEFYTCHSLQYGPYPKKYKFFLWWLHSNLKCCIKLCRGTTLSYSTEIQSVKRTTTATESWKIVDGKEYGFIAINPSNISVMQACSWYFEKLNSVFNASAYSEKFYSFIHMSFISAPLHIIEVGLLLGTSFKKLNFLKVLDFYKFPKLACSPYLVRWHVTTVGITGKLLIMELELRIREYALTSLTTARKLKSL
jgi:hypothetical protein